MVEPSNSYLLNDSTNTMNSTNPMNPTNPINPITSSSSEGKG